MVVGPGEIGIRRTGQGFEGEGPHPFIHVHERLGLHVQVRAGQAEGLGHGDDMGEIVFRAVIGLQQPPPVGFQVIAVIVDIGIVIAGTVARAG